MAKYVRPQVDTPVFLDAEGAPIPYGHRWDRIENGAPTSSPPDDSYSVSTHPERFAPVVTVANALVEHLERTYDVSVDRDAPTPEWMLDRNPDAGNDVVQTVIITPTNPQCSPLTLVETTFPSVRLRAGASADEPFPVCGCDACDDPLTEVLDSLEYHVSSVVKGHLRERLTWRWVETQWDFPDGSSSSKALRSTVPREDVARLKKLRRTHPSGWLPWPLKSA